MPACLFSKLSAVVNVLEVLKEVPAVHPEHAILLVIDVVFELRLGLGRPLV